MKKNSVEIYRTTLTIKSGQANIKMRVIPAVEKPQSYWHGIAKRSKVYKRNIGVISNNCTKDHNNLVYYVYSDDKSDTDNHREALLRKVVESCKDQAKSSQSLLEAVLDLCRREGLI